MVSTYIRARLDLFKEEGQALVEYALVISLIALTMLAALGFLSGKIQGIFSAIGSGI